MKMGHWWRALPAVLVLVSFVGRAEASDATATKTVLLSIVNLDIGKDEYVDSFDIQTWDVRPLAVCQIPIAWTLSAGRSIDASGGLSGGAGGTVAALTQNGLRNLKALFLIVVPAEIQAEDRIAGDITFPATLKGTVSVGRYGDPSEPAQRPLTVKNYEFQAATQCPRSRRP